MSNRDDYSPAPARIVGTITESVPEDVAGTQSLKRWRFCGGSPEVLWLNGSSLLLRA
jgi:hypothetical protein